MVDDAPSPSSGAKGQDTSVCTILVVGAAKNRVLRVVELIRQQSVLSDNDNHIRYIPCVATFDSYAKGSSTQVRYLVSIEHFYIHASAKNISGAISSKPQSLLTLLEEGDGGDRGKEKTEQEQSERIQFPPIAGVAIGCGIEGVEDSERIATFLGTLLESTAGTEQQPLLVRTIEPTPPFCTMQEELQYIRSLKTLEERQASGLGPHKMVAFVQQLAQDVVTATMKALVREEDPSPLLMAAEATTSTANVPSTTSSEILEGAPALKPEEQTPTPSPGTTDTADVDQYVCHMCRRVLFSATDLEDPPHTPSRHSLAYRKMDRAGSNRGCSSYFLQDRLDWMMMQEDDSTAATTTEGKFACPYCAAKLGSWNWSGSQCSCGTWVVPALQIAQSRVDCVSSATRVTATRRAMPTNKNVATTSSVATVLR